MIYKARVLFKQSLSFAQFIEEYYDLKMIKFFYTFDVIITYKASMYGISKK